MQEKITQFFSCISKAKYLLSAATLDESVAMRRARHQSEVRLSLEICKKNGRIFLLYIQGGVSSFSRFAW
jgi:hypothetical protein